MFRTPLGIALCAVFVGAAAQATTHGQAERRAGRPDYAPPKCRVNVHVNAEGYVVVNNEPVHPRGCADGNAVTWRVRTPGYGFDPAAGIAFDKGRAPNVRCEPGPNARTYVCRFAADAPGTYNYSIRVQGPAGAKVVDPSVIID